MINPGTSDVVEKYSSCGKLSGNTKFLVPPQYRENGCNPDAVVVLGITAGLLTEPVLNMNLAAPHVAPITELPDMAYTPAGKVSVNVN